MFSDFDVMIIKLKVFSYLSCMSAHLTDGRRFKVNVASLLEVAHDTLWHLEFSTNKRAPLPLDLLPVSQTSYKQVCKWLVESTSNGKNMDKFTALYT